MLKSGKNGVLKILMHITNKKILFISFIPTIILILLFIVRFLLNLEAEFLELLIPIFSILTTLFIPFITNEIEKNKEKQKLKKIYQECFNNLGSLCSLCIERIGQLLSNDIKIFQLSVKLKRYQMELLKFNITYNLAGKSETIVIGDKLRIWLNVDKAEGRVWGATISLIIDDYLIQDKEEVKSELYLILGELRRKNDL